MVVAARGTCASSVRAHASVSVDSECAAGDAIEVATSAAHAVAAGMHSSRGTGVFAADSSTASAAARLDAVWDNVFKR